MAFKFLSSILLPLLNYFKKIINKKYEQRRKCLMDIYNLCQEITYTRDKDLLNKDVSDRINSLRIYHENPNSNYKNLFCNDKDTLDVVDQAISSVRSCYQARKLFLKDDADIIEELSSPNATREREEHNREILNRAARIKGFENRSEYGVRFNSREDLLAKIFSAEMVNIKLMRDQIVQIIEIAENDYKNIANIKNTFFAIPASKYYLHDKEAFYTRDNESLNV